MAKCECGISGRRWMCKGYSFGFGSAVCSLYLLYLERVDGLLFLRTVK